MDTLWITNTGPAVLWRGTHWEALAFVAARGLGERVAVLSATDAMYYREACNRFPGGVALAEAGV